jgi:hypothetical protein
MIVGLAGAAAALAVMSSAVLAADATATFDDPFLQVTAAIRDCPPREPQKFTQEQMHTEAHARAERGTRCFQSGRCRLPNAYMYDQEIIPRVRQAILADGRFGESSIAVEGQRRWVWLKGCVRSRAQAIALKKLVGNIDDVEAVIDELVIKPR